MADFINVPVVDTFHVESTDSGMPFSRNALAIQANSFLNRGVYVGATSLGCYAARVDNSLYFVSTENMRSYVWNSGNNFTTPYDLSSKMGTVYYVPVGNINKWNVELTSFPSVNAMTEGFYDSLFPDTPPREGDIAIVIEPSPESAGEILVDLTLLIDGADTILVSGESQQSTVDPNASGGISSPSVPTGTFDDTSDPIPIQSIPSISAANVGLVSLFKPTRQELSDLGSYLWTHLLDFIENLQKFFTNPMDYMIALNIMPCNPAIGAQRRLKIGNFLTDISMSPVISQWYEFDCGVIQISPYWGSALDFSPNTRITMMLPFIGSVALNTDEVMGQTLGLVYRMDLLSGNCVAMVTVNGDVLYQFTGECAVPVPMTASDWSRVYSAFVGAVVAVGVGAVGATAAMSAATGVGNMIGASTAATNASKAVSSAGRAFSQVNQSSKGIAGVRAMRENLVAASDLALQAGEMASSAPAQVGRALRATRIANTVNNVATNVMSAKTQIQHTGTVSGSSGILGNRIPYVMIEYPNQSLAENYKHYVGYPSNMTASLGSLSGYTECEQLILSGITATDPELEEITEALKGGVYL